MNLSGRIQFKKPMNKMKEISINKKIKLKKNKEKEEKVAQIHIGKTHISTSRLSRLTR